MLKSCIVEIQWIGHKHVDILLFSTRREEFEDTKRVIKIRKSKKDRHTNGQKKNGRTNSDLQNTAQKAKDRARRTPLKTGD